MEVRELQAVVLTAVLISQDDAFIKAAMEATQEHNKRQQGSGDTPPGSPQSSLLRMDADARTSGE